MGSSDFKRLADPRPEPLSKPGTLRLKRTIMSINYDLLSVIDCNLCCYMFNVLYSKEGPAIMERLDVGESPQNVVSTCSHCS